MIFNSTSRARVQDAERLWIPKFVLRILTILVAILSIGCLAWAFAQDGASYLEYLANTGDDGNDNFSYVSQDRYLLPWQFIPVSPFISVPQTDDLSDKIAGRLHHLEPHQCSSSSFSTSPYAPRRQCGRRSSTLVILRRDGLVCYGSCCR